MFNYGYTTKKDTEERNASWPKIPEHPYINSCRFSIWKKNALLNLINHNQILIIFFIFQRSV